MSKKVKWIVAGIAIFLLCIIVLVGRNNSERIAGEKRIIIHVEGIEHNETIVVDSECETLAELLKTHAVFEAVIEDGPYGAYLTTLLGEKQNQDKGPWWVYDSANNWVCTSLQHCPSLDKIMIKDKDEFTFSLINEFE